MLVKNVKVYFVFAVAKIAAKRDRGKIHMHTTVYNILISNECWWFYSQNYNQGLLKADFRLPVFLQEQLG